jgi:hypothetical protein
VTYKIASGLAKQEQRVGRYASDQVRVFPAATAEPAVRIAEILCAAIPAYPASSRRRLLPGASELV